MGRLTLGMFMLITLKLWMSRLLRALGVSVALTFDDILLRPRYSSSRADIRFWSRLTPNLWLRLPIISAPMDKVTEHEMAIALGRLGGIGIIHRNLTVERQAEEVRKVKAAGFLVGAAIGADPGVEERVEALIKAGVDIILVDSAHGESKKVIDTIKWLKENYAVQVIAGNVATYEGAKAMLKAGADAIRLGMGPGSICTTRIITGMGVPQVTAILEAIWATLRRIPIIADGGIRYSGDMVKAFALGAETVMLGQLLASAIESPGQVYALTADQVPARFRSISGKVHALTIERYRELAPEKAALIEVPKTEKQLYCFKEYRGMGSEGAMAEGARVKSEGEYHGKSYEDGSTLTAEGVECLVPVKGTVASLVAQWTGGMTSGFYDLGVNSVDELWKKVQYNRITPASLQESHPHDVIVTNAGKSYE